MIYAILAIFMTMNLAEREVIIDLACSYPSVTPKLEVFDNREGLLTVYEDDSSTVKKGDSTLVRNSDGLELYYN